MPSPKLVPLLLTDGERESLEALVRKRTASQSLACGRGSCWPARRTAGSRR